MKKLLFVVLLLVCSTGCADDINYENVVECLKDRAPPVSDEELGKAYLDAISNDRILTLEDIVDRKAYDECQNLVLSTANLIKADTCVTAREIADSTAPTLPMQMSSTVAYTHVMAMDSTLVTVFQYSYDEEFFNAYAAEEGVSPASLINKQRETILSNVCSTDDSTAFYRCGGKMVYVYKFSDGKIAMQVKIDSCK